MVNRAINEIKDIESGKKVNKTNHPKESENREVDHYNLRMEQEINGKSLAHTLEQWNQVQKYVAKAKKQFKYIIYNGIGGSFLGSYLILTYMKTENYNDILDHKQYFCPNTDSDYFNELTKLCKPEETLLITISKSGTTAETACNNQAFIDWIKPHVQNVYEHVVAVTIQGSNLDKNAQENHYGAVFHMNESTGGRTSIITAVSMICCAFSNIDFKEFAFGMSKMDCNTRIPSAKDNLAMKMAAELYQYTPGSTTFKEIRNYIILFYSEFAKQYAHYNQQLYMESLGKQYIRTDYTQNIKTGLSIFGGIGTSEQHAFMQQVQKGLNNNIVKFISFAKRDFQDIKQEKIGSMGRQLQSFVIGTQMALIKNNVPFQHVQVQQRNEFCLGELIALEERIVTILGCWLNINAYDQPGVQDGKLSATIVTKLSKTIEEELNSYQYQDNTLEQLAKKFNCEQYVIENILVDMTYNAEIIKILFQIKTDILFTTSPATKQSDTPVYSVVYVADQIFASNADTIIISDKQGKKQRSFKVQQSEIAQLIPHPTASKIVSLGFDNSVIFCDLYGTALFKYTHNSPLQCGCFSPDGKKFLSCSQKDIAIYIEGNKSVNKITTDDTVRSCCFGRNGDWFAIGLENGMIQCCDLEGKCFNRVQVGAAVWSLTIIDGEEEQPKEGQVEFNSVGIFNNDASLTQQQKEEKKLAQQFVENHQIAKERIIFMSWNQRYCVLDPSCLNHLDVLYNDTIKQKDKKQFFKKQDVKVDEQQVATKEQKKFLIAEQRLPFIPIAGCRYKEDYMLVTGVSAKVIVLELKTGKILKEILECNERDPQIACPPYNKHAEPLDQQQYIERVNQWKQNTTTSTLRYAGINSVWGYCICMVDQDKFVVGLSTGTAVCCQIQNQQVVASYQNIVAQRIGLTEVKVYDYLSGGSLILSTSLYVKKVQMAKNILFVIGDGKLLIYKIESIQAQQNINGQKTLKPQIQAEQLYQHNLTFAYVDLIATSSHIVILLDNAILTMNLAGQDLHIHHFNNNQITCAQVLPAMPEDNILIGTAEGIVYQLDIHERLINKILSHFNSIKQIKISADLDKIGILDQEDRLGVYNIYGTLEQVENQPIFSLYSIQDFCFDQIDNETLSVFQQGKIRVLVGQQEVFSNQIYQFQNSNKYDKILFLKGKSLVYTQDREVHTLEVPQTAQISFYIREIYQILITKNGIQIQDDFDEQKDIDYDAEIEKMMSKCLQLSSQSVPVSYLIQVAVCALFAGRINQAKFCLNLAGSAQLLLFWQQINDLGFREYNNIKNKNTTFSIKEILMCIFACCLNQDFQSAAILCFLYQIPILGSQILNFVKESGETLQSQYNPLIDQIITHMIAIAPISVEIAQYSKNFYVKLGVDEKQLKSLQLKFQSQQTTKNEKLLDFLDIYDQNVVVDNTQSQDIFGTDNQQVKQQKSALNYNKDYRIFIRSQIMKTLNNQQQKELLQAHAKFFTEIHQYFLASLTYFENEDFEKAVKILIDQNAWNLLIKLLEVLPPLSSSSESLKQAYREIMQFSLQKNDFQTALIIAQKLQDIQTIIKVYLNQHDWKALEAISHQYPIYKNLINEAYAQELLRQGKFIQAIAKLKECGNEEQGQFVMKELVKSGLLSQEWQMCKKLINVMVFGGEMTENDNEEQQQNDTELQLQNNQEKHKQEKIVGIDSVHMHAQQTKLLFISAFKVIQQFLEYKELDQHNTNITSIEQENDENVISAVQFIFDHVTLPDDFTATSSIEIENQNDFTDKSKIDENKLLTQQNGLISNQLGVQQQTFIQTATQAPLSSISDLKLQQAQLDSLLFYKFDKVCLAGYLAAKDSKQFAQSCLLMLTTKTTNQILQSSVKKLALKLGVKITRLNALLNNQTKPESEYVPVCQKCGCQLIGQKIITPSQADFKRIESLPLCSPTLANVCKQCGNVNFRASSMQVLPLLMITYTDDSSEEEFLSICESVNIKSDEQQEKLGLQDQLIEKIKQLPVHLERNAIMVPIDILEQIDDSRFITIRENGNTYVFLKTEDNEDDEIVYDEEYHIFEQLQDYEQDRL